MAGNLGRTGGPGGQGQAQTPRQREDISAKQQQLAQLYSKIAEEGVEIGPQIEQNATAALEGSNHRPGKKITVARDTNAGRSGGEGGAAGGVGGQGQQRGVAGQQFAQGGQQAGQPLQQPGAQQQQLPQQPGEGDMEMTQLDDRYVDDGESGAMA